MTIDLDLIVARGIIAQESNASKKEELTQNISTISLLGFVVTGKGSRTEYTKNDKDVSVHH